MLSLIIAAVDQPWQVSAGSTANTVWALPLVLIGIIVAAMVVQRKPWVLLALGLSLVVVVPLCSALLR